MTVLVAYDVSTVEAAGRRRLSRVARACKDYGVRVQKSVFECQVGMKDWARLRDRLLSEYKEGEDSLRFYFLDEAAVRTYGTPRCGQTCGFDGAAHILIPRTTSADLMTGVSRIALARLLIRTYAASPENFPTAGCWQLPIRRKRCSKPLWPQRLARPRSPRRRTRGAD